ncbi:hypothetical protein G7Z17_g65 [Cylindrodendrum hubeiense]|uniref:Rhodopsin domain-containing protein n=1 Tax=Cylindrodendrum hubeiense TaxID=595255 RepID=A0A9P5HHP9_9HYPO|nr:hypothetical protein G7Z17_g65 [Cylindrodendrum hubeiense]
MALDVPAGTPDRGPGVEAMCIALMALSIIATIARITSKLVVKQFWWWDDFFAIMSLPIQLTLLGIIMVWRNIGLGLHAEVVMAVNPLYLLDGAKYLYIAIFFFDVSITFPKMAAIFFYARVFRSTNRTFRIHLWIAGCLVAGWIISALVSTVFQCSPIEKAWNTSLPGTCINTYVWYLTTAVLSCVIDCYILLLPVPMIWGLNISLRRRIYLLAAFFLAYSVIVLSIGRLISTIKVIPTLAADLTWNMPSYLRWACVEGAISLISVSVPNMAALVKAMAGTSWISSTQRSSKKQQTPLSYSGEASAYRSQARNGDFQRLESMQGPGVSDADSQISLQPMDGYEPAKVAGRIHVRTDFHVSSKEGQRSHTELLDADKSGTGWKQGLR